jgi:hypothetical protein
MAKIYRLPFASVAFLVHLHGESFVVLASIHPTMADICGIHQRRNVQGPEKIHGGQM